MYCVGSTNTENYFKEKWRIKKGGGPLGINLVHDIDLMRLSSVAEIISVQALTWLPSIRGYDK